ncbi:MAG: ATP-binding cassette domain-containing protein, partial [Succinivibrionaceae bacterium]|nr:ATP-binding cassette domain-containing protein [Succinivibrionaceae bacterium]
MSILSMDSACLSYSDLPLLDHADFSIEAGERVCIVGRNGVGKSTLLKIFNRETSIDEGSLVFQQDLNVCRLEQDPPHFSREQTIMEYLLSCHFARLPDGGHEDHYEVENRIRVLLGKMDLDPEKPLNGLSGGLLRRVALADALSSQPDLLLLDE